MRRTAWQHFDFLLLGAVAVLTIFGITMIRSTVAGNVELTQANLPQRQLIFAVVGFIVVFIVSALDYHLWSSVSGTMYLFTFMVLAILYIVGTAVYGSARWFEAGIINIQPSELAKVVAILVLADYFTRHQEHIQDFRWVLRSFLLIFGLVIWIVLQPNLSTSIVIMVIWFTLWWAAGMRARHLIYIAAIGAVIIAISIPAFPVLKKAKLINDYQIQRINSFLQPASEAEARYGDRYNIEQAQISIGSGGLMGRGYGHGTQVQLRFLKVRWSDFIFSAMAEEFGFIGVVAMMIILLFVIFRCLRAARIARDTFGALIAYGVATLIAFQAMVNIGVNLKLMPATGLPLPFISYGGSSLLSLLLGVGLVESVILRHKALEF
jgi:rod shape determining protein RodA